MPKLPNYNQYNDVQHEVIFIGTKQKQNFEISHDDQIKINQLAQNELQLQATIQFNAYKFVNQSISITINGTTYTTPQVKQYQYEIQTYLNQFKILLNSVLPATLQILNFQVDTSNVSQIYMIFNTSTQLQIQFTDYKTCLLLGFKLNKIYTSRNYLQANTNQYIQSDNPYFIYKIRRLNVICNQIDENKYINQTYHSVLASQPYQYNPGDIVTIQGPVVEIQKQKLMGGLLIEFQDELYQDIDEDTNYSINLIIGRSKKEITKQQSIIEEKQQMLEQQNQQIQYQQQQEMKAQEQKIADFNNNDKILTDQNQNIQQNENNLTNQENRLRKQDADLYIQTINKNLDYLKSQNIPIDNIQNKYEEIQNQYKKEQENFDHQNLKQSYDKIYQEYQTDKQKNKFTQKTFEQQKQVLELQNKYIQQSNTTEYQNMRNSLFNNIATLDTFNDYFNKISKDQKQKVKQSRQQLQELLEETFKNQPKKKAKSLQLNLNELQQQDLDLKKPQAKQEAEINQKELDKEDLEKLKDSQKYIENSSYEALYKILEDKPKLKEYFEQVDPQKYLEQLNNKFKTSKYNLEQNKQYPDINANQTEKIKQAIKNNKVDDDLTKTILKYVQQVIYKSNALKDFQKVLDNDTDYGKYIQMAIKQNPEILKYIPRAVHLQTSQNPFTLIQYDPKTGLLKNLPQQRQSKTAQDIEQSKHQQQIDDKKIQKKFQQEAPQ